MVKRQARESIEQQKHHMIAALYANSAFDESKDGIEERKKRIKGLEEHFAKAIESVYHPERAEADIDWSNPFWAAARRAQQRRLERVRGEGMSVGEVVAQNQQEQPQVEYDQS